MSNPNHQPPARLFRCFFHQSGSSLGSTQQSPYNPKGIIRNKDFHDSIFDPYWGLSRNRYSSDAWPFFYGALITYSPTELRNVSCFCLYLSCVAPLTQSRRHCDSRISLNWTGMLSPLGSANPHETKRSPILKRIRLLDLSPRSITDGFVKWCWLGSTRWICNFVCAATKSPNWKTICQICTPKALRVRLLWGGLSQTCTPIHDLKTF